MARKQSDEKAPSQDTETSAEASAPEAASAKPRKARAAKSASAKKAAKGEKKSEKKENAKSAAKAAPAPAAVNKTQAVKAFLAANPEAGPSEVSRALKEQGIEITPNYVSLIKSQLKKKGSAKAKPGPKASTGPREMVGGLSIELLVKAKQAAEALGGVEAARSALAALARLLD